MYSVILLPFHIIYVKCSYKKIEPRGCIEVDYAIDFVKWIEVFNCISLLINTSNFFNVYSYSF